MTKGKQWKKNTIEHIQIKKYTLYSQENVLGETNNKWQGWPQNNFCIKDQTAYVVSAYDTLISIFLVTLSLLVATSLFLCRMKGIILYRNCLWSSSWVIVPVLNSVKSPRDRSAAWLTTFSEEIFPWRWTYSWCVSHEHTGRVNHCGCDVPSLSKNVIEFLPTKSDNCFP